MWFFYLFYNNGRVTMAYFLSLATINVAARLGVRGLLLLQRNSRKRHKLLTTILVRSKNARAMTARLFDVCIYYIRSIAAQSLRERTRFVYGILIY